MADPLSPLKTNHIVTATLLALAAGGGLSAQTPADSARARLPVITPTWRAVARLDVPIHPRVAASPDGRFLAALQTRPDPVLWIVPTDGGAPFAFRKNWAAYQPRWSPSGTRIGFIAAIGPPRIWTVEVDPESGRPVDPPRMLIRTTANAFAFAPDGERIALVSSKSTAAGRSEIQIVDWETRSMRVLLRENGMIYWLDWSPDGGSIYYGLVPNEPPTAGAHIIARARARDGASEAIATVAEFLGLAPGGSRLLYRPLGRDAGGDDVLEVSSPKAVESGPARPTRLRMPPGPAPTWGASAGSLLQVRPDGPGNLVLELILCPERRPGS